MEICKNAYRIDVMEDTERYLTVPFQQDNDGFMSGQAIVTNIGVFTYRDAAGKVLKELRPPEEVFDVESMESLQMIPLTNNHPKKLVNIENIKKLQIGFTGDSVTRDQYALSTPIKFTDQDTVSDIQNGKRALSCGYTADLEFTPGVWMGVPYDAIQRNIRYNHIAVVDRGRAGDLAKMRLRTDSSDAMCIYTDDYSNQDNNVSLEENKFKFSQQKPINKEDSVPNVNLKTIRLDDVEYQAEPEILQALNTAKKDSADKTIELEKIKNDFATEMSKLKADHDTLKDTLDKTQKELSEIKNDSATIEQKALQKVKLWDNAKMADIDVNIGTTLKEDGQIKAEIIKKVFPNAILDDKDEIYIDARYDSAVEILISNNEKETKNHNKEKVFGDFQQQNNKEIMDSDQARNQYIADLENNWKKVMDGGK